jgi:hypothetical protein
MVSGFSSLTSSADCHLDGFCVAAGKEPSKQRSCLYGHRGRRPQPHGGVPNAELSSPRVEVPYRRPPLLSAHHSRQIVDEVIADHGGAL